MKKIILALYLILFYIIFMTERLEVETWEGKEDINVQRIRKVYVNLINDITHPEPCDCPSCLFQEHKKQGGKYNKEIFFLNWLEFELRFSLVNQKEKIVFETVFDPGSYKRFIEDLELIKFSRGYGRIKALSKFLEINFPEIDYNQKRLKLRLWRFKKSGVKLKAAKEINKRYFKTHPFDLQKSKEGWRELRLAQKIADFIYSQPGHKTTQRQICRRYFQKKSVENLEEMRSLLNSNYGIICEYGKRKNQIVYIGKRKSSRGRFFKVGP